MTDGQRSKFDPVGESIKGFLCITFAKSTSQSYPMALALAKSSPGYEEHVIGKKLVHLTAFSNTTDDIARAQSILGYVSGWASTQLYVTGEMLHNAYALDEVISCYLAACRCADWQAHCLKMIDDPDSDIENKQNILSASFTIRLEDEDSQDESKFKMKVKVDRYIFPCSHLHHSFEFQRGLSLDTRGEGLLVLACDANGWTPEALDPLLRALPKPVFGGVFPHIIHESRNHERGTLVLGHMQHGETPP